MKTTLTPTFSTPISGISWTAATLRGHAAFYRDSRRQLARWRIAREFDLTPHEAESAIEIARNEVAL